MVYLQPDYKWIEGTSTSGAPQVLEGILIKVTNTEDKEEIIKILETMGFI